MSKPHSPSPARKYNDTTVEEMKLLPRHASSMDCSSPNCSIPCPAAPVVYPSQVSKTHPHSFHPEPSSSQEVGVYILRVRFVRIRRRVEESVGGPLVVGEGLVG